MRGALAALQASGGPPEAQIDPGRPTRRERLPGGARVRESVSGLREQPGASEGVKGAVRPHTLHLSEAPGGRGALDEKRERPRREEALMKAPGQQRVW